MKSIRSVLFIFLIPIVSHGVGKSVVNMGSDLIRSLGLKSELTQFFDRSGINPKSTPQETLKDLNEAWEDPLRLIDIDPQGAGSSNLSRILESDVYRAFLFFRLNPSDEQQMKRLIELLDWEAEFIASHYIFPNLTAKERRGMLTSFLPRSWKNFMEGLEKEIASGRIKPQYRVDLKAGILSASKTELDTGTPIHKNLDELGMYDLHESRVVRNPDEDKLISEALSRHEDNIVSINIAQASRLVDEGYFSLFRYNIKPRLLFNILVWGGENKPGRYRFLPDPKTGETLRTPYQHTKDEVQRLAEIYTNPHFNLKPHHLHWDEVAVPVIQDRSTYANKEVILRAWEDFEWTMDNRDLMLDHRVAHLSFEFKQIFTQPRKIKDEAELFDEWLSPQEVPESLNPPVNSFTSNIQEIFYGDRRKKAFEALLKACAESESLMNHLNLNSIINE